jgi:multiple sugar transport system ATP-binding protein
VAQFIGSPQMNLLPVRVDTDTTLLLGDRRLPVQGPLQPLLAAHKGRALTAGLRAEHLTLAPATNRNLPAEVCHIEALGNEQLVTARLHDGQHLLQLRCGPLERLVPGQTVQLAIDPLGWRLFEDSGEALLPPPTAPAVTGPSLPPIP